jgi:hypothetical protein
VNSVKREMPQGRAGEGFITGRWNQKLDWLTPRRPGRLAMEFANESSPLRFTKRRGPLEYALWDFLTAPPRVDGFPGGSRTPPGMDPALLPPFRFAESDWRWRQDQLRGAWESLPLAWDQNLESWTIPHIVGHQDLVVTREGFELPVRGAFWFVKDRLVFSAATLWELLLLDLYSAGRDYLRKCQHPGCPKPYFVGKSNMRVCDSAECRRWGRNQTKLKWWNENRRKESNGTEKTQ